MSIPARGYLRGKVLAGLLLLLGVYCGMVLNILPSLEIRLSVVTNEKGNISIQNPIGIC